MKISPSPVTSKFEVSDEFVIAMWDGIARELHELVAPSGLGESFVDAALHYFCGMLASFPDRVLCGVGCPTEGTTNHLGIGISDKFHRHLTATAEDFARRFSH